MEPMTLPYGKTDALPYGLPLLLTKWLTLRTNVRTNEELTYVESGSFVSQRVRKGLNSRSGFDRATGRFARSAAEGRADA